RRKLRRGARRRPVPDQRQRLEILRRQAGVPGPPPLLFQQRQMVGGDVGRQARRFRLPVIDGQGQAAADQGLGGAALGGLGPFQRQIEVGLGAAAGGGLGHDDQPRLSGGLRAGG